MQHIVSHTYLPKQNKSDLVLGQSIAEQDQVESMPVYLQLLYASTRPVPRSPLGSQTTTRKVKAVKNTSVHKTTVLASQLDILLNPLESKPLDGDIWTKLTYGIILIRLS